MSSEKLPLLALNRNFTLTTNRGHSIAFVKGKPTHVPRAVYQEAMAIGALPVDGEEVDLLGDEKKDAAPSDPAERAPIILKAIEDLVLGNQREDFTAAGSPTVEAVGRTVGFKVQAKEIQSVWQTYHDKKAAEVDG